MRQILQHLRTGQIELAEVPAPGVRPGCLLIQTRKSLISAGTERMLVEFAKGSLLAKARAQPDKVRQVLDKISTDGLLPTLEAVFARLDEPMPLGYCNAGVVVGVGSGAAGFEVGDRVVSNGPHAEIVAAPTNLCAKIPSSVSDEQAAFTAISAIALQGIRLVGPTIGESVCVVGLGLIGLIAVQLLVANGCRVIGVDLDARRLELARQMGADTVEVAAGADAVAAARAFSHGRGVDSVLITASAKSNEIMHQAAEMCRQRGRIVLVGVVGLELRRSDFYKKELTFQVSCSYGPGRYDPAYEEHGHDYPFGFVRWTEQRNFEAVLGLMASDRLDVTSLISHRFDFADAAKAYQTLTGNGEGLGMILEYAAGPPPSQRTVELRAVRRTVVTATPTGRVVVGLIGAGNFAHMTLMPALSKTAAHLKTIASHGGLTGSTTGRKFGFRQATSDYRTILDDPEINLVLVATRHNCHAPLVMEALAAGKHVFVEKPLCLTHAELEDICRLHEQRPEQLLLVGFNRRFSPHAQKIQALLIGRTEPVTMSMMVNAGVTPADSWVHDPAVGGGRIIGEACHWIDLMVALTGSPVTRVCAARVGPSPALAVRDDKMSVTLSFADGSIGTLHYFGNGSKAYPKETLEVFSDGRVLRLDNFRKLRGFGWRNFSRLNLWRMDKGHLAEFATLVDAVASGVSVVVPVEEVKNVMRATFAAVESARTGQAVEVTCD